MIIVEGKTVQQVLDEIAESLIAQGTRCAVGESCRYGDGQGNHCAVGFLLPEDNEKLMDAIGSVVTITQNFGDLGTNDKFLRDNTGLLNVVQRIHDGAYYNTLDSANQMWDILEHDSKLFEVDISKFKPFYFRDVELS